MRTQLVATVAGGVILTLLQVLNGMAFGPVPNVQLPPNMLGWLLLSNLLIAGVLAWFARRAAWTGWRLAAALFVISYGIGTLTALIEAYVFNFFTAPGELRAMVMRSIPPAVAFPPLLVWLAGRWSTPGSPARPAPTHGAAGWAARFAACAVAYLVLYFTAGTIIFPYVRSFYEARPLPSGLTIILLQLCLRGPIFAAIGLLIARMAPAARSTHALMVAVAMSVLGGVAPLIIPNPYFPDAVRWVHFAEVVSSNFVFGAIVGWLLGGTREQASGALGRAA